jgi:hypothetical protein
MGTAEYVTDYKKQTSAHQYKRAYSVTKVLNHENKSMVHK